MENLLMGQHASSVQLVHSLWVEALVKFAKKELILKKVHQSAMNALQANSQIMETLARIVLLVFSLLLLSHPHAHNVLKVKPLQLVLGFVSVAQQDNFLIKGFVKLAQVAHILIMELLNASLAMRVRDHYLNLLNVLIVLLVLIHLMDNASIALLVNQPLLQVQLVV